MICDDCQGTGAWWDEEGENAEPCPYCSGRGTIPLWMWLRDRWDEIIGSRIDLWIEHLSYSKIGNRYWRRLGCERKARRLAENKTAFQLAALHGERLNRLRKFADFIEHDGYNVGHNYRVETRLVAEAARACEIKASE